MKQPGATITLSSEEGEGLIAHVQQSNLPAAVAGRVEQSIRLYFWLVVAWQEATLRVQRLRNVLFGARPHPQERSESEGETTSSEVPGQAAGEAEATLVDEMAPGWERTRRDTAPEVAPGVGAPKPKGGHRPGPGRRGADAYVGAERIECRHEELAVGQRCPVCGQGTF